MVRFYGIMCVVGTIVPWLFFADFFASFGLDVVQFVSLPFANAVAGGFTADILISIAVFGVWSYLDAVREGVRNWWLVVPSTLCVGLSLSLPLYLLLRERVYLSRIAHKEGPDSRDR